MAEQEPGGSRPRGVAFRCQSMDLGQNEPKEALVTLNKMVPRLSLVHLENELRVLSRVLYRGKSQHRREKGFQKMTKVCKQVKRCVDEDVFLAIKQLSQRHKERASQLGPHLLQAAKKLVQNTAFIKQLLSFMEKAFIDLLQQLNMNLFVPYNLVMSASLSRLWFSLKLHLTALCETHSHLQLLGELCGQHSLPQLPPSLSAAKTTAPTKVTEVSLGEDLLAQRMKDFALPSTNKQSLTTAIKQDTCTAASLDTKQCHNPSEQLISSRVPLHQDPSVTSHQQQVEQKQEQKLMRHEARGDVLVRCKTFRPRVKSRRLLNRLRKRRKYRVPLKSFRRYQTPWKADRCYTASLRRYSSRKILSQDKQLQSQTALQKRIASNHMIDDIFSILEKK